MITKQKCVFIGYSLIPLSLTLLLVLFLPHGLDIEIYPWYLFIAIALFFLLVIISPIYFIILSNHYLVQNGINIIFCLLIPVISGIGNLILLNFDFIISNANYDFKRSILFYTELAIVGAILLVGSVCLVYQYYKRKSLNHQK